MYKLNAIGEAHPFDRFSSIVRSQKNISDDEKTEIDIYHLKSIEKNPSCVLDKSYWDILASKIYKLRSEEIRRWWIRKKLSVIHKTYLAESNELSKDYTALYFEGIGISAIENIAKNLGINVISLDKNNKYYRPLSYLQYTKDDHINRENYWISQIIPSNKINKSLLIAGKKHIKNHYGLVDKLNEKSIKIVVVGFF